MKCPISTAAHAHERVLEAAQSKHACAACRGHLDPEQNTTGAPGASVWTMAATPRNSASPWTDRAGQRHRSRGSGDRHDVDEEQHPRGGGEMDVEDLAVSLQGRRRGHQRADARTGAERVEVAQHLEDARTSSTCSGQSTKVTCLPVSVSTVKYSVQLALLARDVVRGHRRPVDVELRELVQHGGVGAQVVKRAWTATARRRVDQRFAAQPLGVHRKPSPAVTRASRAGVAQASTSSRGQRATAAVGGGLPGRRTPSRCATSTSKPGLGERRQRPGATRMQVRWSRRPGP